MKKASLRSISLRCPSVARRLMQSCGCLERVVRRPHGIGFSRFWQRDALFAGSLSHKQLAPGNRSERDSELCSESSPSSVNCVVLDSWTDRCYP